ncbi:MMPL family transporter [Streptomyces sp. H10-C2]|uniref:MMPL family transporter n=1 Tax=unclassified Streptomyces TaxID=2593676 RepID=UPI0024BB525D|nr:MULTISPECIES: MMPL family transporter [unclassified Streptomyces]MDJ0340058.1 MMPL family transporter [Streptomyces sp. PH10-H1]MDJ0369305.1 MMPL family transporter [Streptomyces sp. H10-C2]
MPDVNRERTVGGWTGVVTARPRLTLLLALLFTALAVVAGSGVADRLSGGGWEAPDSESSYATKALEERFPASQPNLVLLVDSRGAGVDSPQVAAAGRELARRLAADASIAGVTSYWSTGAPGLRAKDHGEAMIAARIVGGDDAVGAAVERIAPEYRGVRGPVDVRIGGVAAVRHELQSTIEDDLVRAEMIALPVTLVLLVMVFGSAVAALLPLGVGIIAILGTNAVLRGITTFTDVSLFAQSLTTVLGLGLGIDYALFIVRRFREELADRGDPLQAVGATLRTAGRTVLFSALTVAAALAAMLVFPQYFLRSFAYAGIAVVLLAAAAALIVLPAALLLLGHRVNALDLRRLWRRRRASATEPREPGAGYAGLARLVMRRAPLFAIGATAGLLLLGLPFLQIQFGTADDRQLPAGAESHAVQQHIREAFPGNPGGGITVLAEGSPSRGALAGYAGRLAALPGVVRVDGPFTAPDGGAAYLTVLPGTEAVDTATQDLVGAIRAVDAQFKTSATGQAAVLVDAQKAIADRLPWAVGMIAVVTLLLVFLLTGSVVIPLQAVLLNALSLTAMFGAVVWVFQDGHLSGLLGFTATGSIETTLPVLMFCLAFGLSMDYGVFLLSRIKEEYDRSGDHQGAIVFGVRRTGGLITAAAVILAVVMVAIGTSRVANTKMLGLGIALAVLMDAMVVRTLLVPAVMKLTGRATWWAPPAIRRFHDRFGISEGGGGVEQDTARAPQRDQERDPESVR